MRTRKPSPFEPQEQFYGLSEADFNALARYNGERGRGIAHTPEWQEKMAVLQAQYHAPPVGDAYWDRMHAANARSFSGIMAALRRRNGGDR